jgi:dynein heavy chain
VKGLYRGDSQKPQNKIQNALFVDKSVSNILKTIKTGDVAISFFAKYGNTTPIKFINCIQKLNAEKFRPYDLEVITGNDNQKESAFDEYYTISAHGIVKVYSERMKKQLKAEGKEELLSTEVVGLSDWMHESTLFNIITNIGFFKSYTITKIFSIWKKNVRYRSFLKTRQRLVSDAFISKPTFAENLMEINRCLFDLQQNKTIFSKIGDNKTWEKGDFNYEQDQTRKMASAQYESIIANKMTVVVRKVQNEIYEKCNLKDVEDQD